MKNTQNNKGVYMKKKIFTIIFTFLLITGVIFLVKINHQEDKVKIQKISTQEAIHFFSQNKSSNDQIVTNPILNDFQVENLESGDFIQYDYEEDKLFIVDYEQLTIIQLSTKEIIKQIKIDKFIPSEVLITQNQIILIGIQEILINMEIVPGRAFPYSESESRIYIFSKQDYSIIRYFSFDETYYLTSTLIGNELYLILANYTIFNPETKTFIYPKYFDSVYYHQQLSPDNLYLSEAGNPTYSIRLMVKIALNEIKPIEVKGILGVEGISKITDSYILLTSALYDQESKTAIHVFLLENLQYKGYVVLKGYLLNQYSMDVYQNYLRAATNTFLNGQASNMIYNVSLNDFKIKSKKEIAPQESIYSIRFDGNYCYLSTFLYIDPLFIFDFSNALSIVEITKNKVDFCCDYLQLIDNQLFTIGTSYDENMRSIGLVLALFDKETLQIKDCCFYEGENIYSEVKYNEKAITRWNDYLFFPIMSSAGQSIQIIRIKDSIIQEAKLSNENDYMLRTIITQNQIIGISSTKIYYYSLKNYQLTAEMVYKTIVN